MNLELNYPNRPKGSPIVISDLGQFPNGESSEVDDAKWARFRARHPLAAKAALAGRKSTARFPDGKGDPLPVVQEEDPEPTLPLDTVIVDADDSEEN